GYSFLCLQVSEATIILAITASSGGKSVKSVVYRLLHRPPENQARKSCQTAIAILQNFLYSTRILLKLPIILTS
ncbi:hypothetical protein, partial [uncultured Nostoc sp.]|uniref:hypothetical protein n=1 Tax=uncultured Nostoc sp. TaxID=340711 RepID=UPI002632CC5D